MTKKPGLPIHLAEFIGLVADKDNDIAILEFDLGETGRIALNMRQAELHSLYQHILSEAAAKRLAFELR